MSSPNPVHYSLIRRPWLSRSFVGSLCAASWVPSSSLHPHNVLHEATRMSGITTASTGQMAPALATTRLEASQPLCVWRKYSIDFDEAYAKTGGGEDVDYCLRVCAKSRDCTSAAARRSRVVHHFWPCEIGVRPIARTLCTSGSGRRATAFYSIAFRSSPTSICRMSSSSRHSSRFWALRRCSHSGQSSSCLRQSMRCVAIIQLICHPPSAQPRAPLQACQECG